MRPAAERRASSHWRRFARSSPWPAKTPRTGKVERREFEYIRHGTQTLIASFDGVTGEVQGTEGNSRTEADFVAYLEALLATDVSAPIWRIVCDNLNTHSLRRCCPPRGPAMRYRRRPWPASPSPRNTLPGRANRNLVFHPGSQAPASEQFQIYRRIEATHRGVYRLLQRDYGPTLPLDLLRQASRGMCRAR